MLEARHRLIVALDMPSVAAAKTMVDRLGDTVAFYKIGYQLAFAGGLPFADTLIGAGKYVFLDLKLHDTGNIVAKGVESVARLGPRFSPSMLIRRPCGRPWRRAASAACAFLPLRC